MTTRVSDVVQAGFAFGSQAVDAGADAVTAHEDRIIAQAQEIISRRFERHECLASPADTRRYLQVLLGGRGHEIFGCVFLDNRHRVLAFEEMFRGTVDGASVYPREVVKAALQHNAAAVVFAHNHPSGVAEPSAADRTITERLQNALALVDVRVLDHFIVAQDTTSFAERGLI